MPSPRRGRSASGGDKLTAEFTSGQLVIGIVCALFFCVVCFMLGILVGKTDPSLQARVDETATTPAPAAATPAATTAPTLGAQQSPRTDGLRPHSTQQPKATELAPLPAAPADGPVKVARTPPAAETTRTRIDTPATGTPAPATPPAPATAAPAAPAPATPAPAPAAAAPAPAATPAPTPATPAPAPATPAPVTMTAVTPADTALTPATPAPAPGTPAPAPAAPTAAAPARGGFGVQIASLGGADRQAKANEFKTKFKQDTGLDCQAIPSEDGQLLRIVVTGYPNRQAADAACAELKKRPGMGDAFVRALP